MTAGGTVAMKYLVQGCESAERLAILISFTDISSDDIKQALSDHYVMGLKASTAAEVNKVLRQNFNRAVQTLENATARHERLKELDLQHLPKSAN